MVQHTVYGERAQSLAATLCREGLVADWRLEHRDYTQMKSLPQGCTDPNPPADVEVVMALDVPVYRVRSLTELGELFIEVVLGKHVCAYCGAEVHPAGVCFDEVTRSEFPHYADHCGDPACLKASSKAIFELLKKRAEAGDEYAQERLADWASD